MKNGKRKKKINKIERLKMTFEMKLSNNKFLFLCVLVLENLNNFLIPIEYRNEKPFGYRKGVVS